MDDTTLVPGLAEAAVGLLAVIGLGVLVLRWRDRMAKSEGKSRDQIQARFEAILQFRTTLLRCVPGVLVIIFGVFYAIDRSNQHESDWWYGLLFIPIGWVLIPLLARKSWRRYKQLQQIADKNEYDSALDQISHP